MSTVAVDRIIGQRLTALRGAAGLSLEALAVRMELSPSTVTKLESGEARASAAQLFTFCEVLGCSPRQIYAPLEEVGHGEEVVSAEQGDLSQGSLAQGGLDPVDASGGGQEENRVIAFPFGRRGRSSV